MDEFADELIAERRSDAPGVLPSDMSPGVRKLVTWLDTFSLWTGRIVAWITVPLCLAIVYEVIMRNQTPPQPTDWAYDISRFLYGALFMLGAGYTLSRGVHIRADFIYRNWSSRFQGIVDSILYIIFYFPGMLFFFYYSADFAWDAFSGGERGMDTSWMPLMWPIKAALPLGVIFLILQGVSELLKSLYAARTGLWPHEAVEAERSANGVQGASQ